MVCREKDSGWESGEGEGELKTGSIAFGDLGCMGHSPPS